jgi:hypothetical protein
MFKPGQFIRRNKQRERASWAAIDPPISLLGVISERERASWAAIDPPINLLGVISERDHVSIFTNAGVCSCALFR